MKKKKFVLPKELEEFDEETVPYSCKVIIYAFLRKENKEKENS